MERKKILRNLAYAVLVLSLLATPALGFYYSYVEYKNCWNGRMWVPSYTGYCPDYGREPAPSRQPPSGAREPRDVNVNVYHITEEPYIDASYLIYGQDGSCHDCGEPSSYCGDGWCTSDESETSCPADCADDPYCGDGICNGDETYQSCHYDCKLTANFYCGDGICRGDETKYSCPEDCGMYPYCGDGECNGAETKYDCPEDCGLLPYCGNGECDLDESRYNCPVDCGLPPYCGDGTCDPDESSYSCSLDCGNPKCSDPTGSEGDTICSGREVLVCVGGFWEFDHSVQCCDNADCPAGYVCESNHCVLRTFCGDGLCLDGENPYNCPEDCGLLILPPPPGPKHYCGDGECNGDETCATCQQDCGLCYYCGDGVCNTDTENQHNCPQDCGEPAQHGIELSTPDDCYEIEQGSQGVFALTLLNTGNTREELTLAASGPAGAWASQPSGLTLPPGGSESWELQVSVPWDAEPGLYDLTASAQNAHVQDSVLLRVDVKLPGEGDGAQANQTVTNTTAGGNMTDGGMTGAAVAGEIPLWLVLLIIIVALFLFFMLLLRKTNVLTFESAPEESSNTYGLGHTLTPDGGDRLR